MNKKTATTLKDVAAHAGVSHKTVSNVIYGRHARVSPDTEARVRAAILELNYHPNMAARYLRNKALAVIALAIPDLVNPYFSMLGSAIVDAAAAQGYTVLIEHTNGQYANEIEVLNGLRPHMIDGILLNPLFLDKEDIVPHQADVPIVLLGERLIGAPFDHILFDNDAASYLAVQHLLGLGRRRIAMIGITDDQADIMPQYRLQGYERALTEAGIPLDPQLIAHIPAHSFHRADGSRAMLSLLALSEPPDAVFACNDLVALGAMKILHQAKLRIPEDIAIIGIDNIEEGLFATPSLSSISVDIQELGRVAVKILLGRIREERTGPPEHIQLPFHLIARESTIGQNFTFTLSNQDEYSPRNAASQSA